MIVLIDWLIDWWLSSLTLCCAIWWYPSRKTTAIIIGITICISCAVWCADIYRCFELDWNVKIEVSLWKQQNKLGVDDERILWSLRYYFEIMYHFGSLLTKTIRKDISMVTTTVSRWDTCSSIVCYVAIIIGTTICCRSSFHHQSEEEREENKW